MKDQEKSGRGGARPGAGRKALPDSKKRSVAMVAYVTKAEQKRCLREAKRAKLKPQAWMRERLGLEA